MLVCGAGLVVLGFLGWHVEVGAIIIGLVLLGGVTGEQLARLVEAARGRRGNGQVKFPHSGSP